MKLPQLSFSLCFNQVLLTKAPQRACCRANAGCKHCFNSVKGFHTCASTRMQAAPL
jgi:hypothetical protein